jgi:hypothetical protein
MPYRFLIQLSANVNYVWYDTQGISIMKKEQDYGVCENATIYEENM